MYDRLFSHPTLIIHISESSDFVCWSISNDNIYLNLSNGIFFSSYTTFSFTHCIYIHMVHSKHVECDVFWRIFLFFLGFRKQTSIFFLALRFLALDVYLPLFDIVKEQILKRLFQWKMGQLGEVYSACFFWVPSSKLQCNWNI